MGTQKDCLNKTTTLSIEIDMLKLKIAKYSHFVLLETLYSAPLEVFERFLKLLPMYMLCFGE